MSYEIKWSGRVSTWHFYGNIDTDQIMQSHIEVYGDERFDDLRIKVVDFTKVDSVDFDERKMTELAYLDRAAAHSNPRIQIACITDKPETNKLFEAYKERTKIVPWKLHRFENQEQVDAWIGQYAKT